MLASEVEMTAHTVLTLVLVPAPTRIRTALQSSVMAKNNGRDHLPVPVHLDCQTCMAAVFTGSVISQTLWLVTLSYTRFASGPEIPTAEERHHVSPQSDMSSEAFFSWVLGHGL